jgi:hypothetical protein
MDRKKGGGNLGDTKYIKINLYLFLGILPLSIVGYYFAVNKENLFFLYEWSILILIVASLIFSIIGFKKKRREFKVDFTLLLCFFCAIFCSLFILRTFFVL